MNVNFITAGFLFVVAFAILVFPYSGDPARLVKVSTRIGSTVYAEYFVPASNVWLPKKGRDWSVFESECTNALKNLREGIPPSAVKTQSSSGSSLGFRLKALEFGRNAGAHPQNKQEEKCK